MRILAVSDEECAALWDHYAPGKLDGYDLIISCGDLKPEYLSFLVTMAKCPVLYVHGNHDTSYSQRPPEGCDCIDDRPADSGIGRLSEVSARSSPVQRKADAPPYPENAVSSLESRRCGYCSDPRAG